jgi:fission process protein 1
VVGAYAIAIGYCVADVGYETYKCHRRGYVDLQGNPTPLTKVIVERSLFQGLASIVVPAAVVHQIVHHAQILTKKYGKYQKYGPTLMGLASLPLMPYIIDPPIEMVLEYAFENFSPWAQRQK